MKKYPIIQIALDFKNLKDALKIANECYKAGIEWIEAGTPLIKSVGIKAIKEIKKNFPNACVIADLKTLDAGALEVEIASEAGANIITISGLASSQTIIEALDSAKKYNSKIMIDLMYVKNILKKSIEYSKIGVNFLCLHTGLDIQKTGASIINKASLLKKIKASVKIPIAIAGGINLENLDNLLILKPDIIIVGRAITNSNNPYKIALEFIKKIKNKSLNA
jgi:3-hexulose-6-phosphate synthase/6-phospho-3-hexuloisomerase